MPSTSADVFIKFMKKTCWSKIMKKTNNWIWCYLFCVIVNHLLCIVIQRNALLSISPIWHAQRLIIQIFQEIYDTWSEWKRYVDMIKYITCINFYAKIPFSMNNPHYTKSGFSFCSCSHVGIFTLSRIMENMQNKWW